jgi:hypothetical protein
VVFESGALNPDGSIVSNDNDEDPLKFEPHMTPTSTPLGASAYIVSSSAGVILDIARLPAHGKWRFTSRS